MKKNIKGMSRIIRNLWNLGENVTKSELCKVLDGFSFIFIKNKK